MRPSRKRIIKGLLPLAITTAGLLTALVLVKQNQDIRKQAAESQTYTCSVTGEKITRVDPAYFGIFTPVDYLPTDSLQRLNFFRKIKEAGFTSVRLQLRWIGVEAIKGNYDWSLYDNIFKAVEQTGLKALPVVLRIPTWAKPASGNLAGKEAIDPQYLPDWQKFMTEAVKRYGTNSGSVAKVVSDWEIWNEPEYVKYYEGTPDDFVTILNQAYAAIKTADSQAKVWSPAVTHPLLTNVIQGTTVPVNNDFFTKVVSEGKFDTFSFHVYADTAASFNLAKEVKTYIKTHGNTTNMNAKVAITETNIHFQPAGSNCDIFGTMGESQKSEMIIDRYTCLSQAGVDNVYYFMALDLKASSSCIYKLGILNNDLTERDSYTAVKQMIQTLTKPQTSPSPTPSSSPTPTPTPAPSFTPTTSPSPRSTPMPTPSPISTPKVLNLEKLFEPVIDQATEIIRQDTKPDQILPELPTGEEKNRNVFDRLSQFWLNLMEALMKKVGIV